MRKRHSMRCFDVFLLLIRVLSLSSTLRCDLSVNVYVFLFAYFMYVCCSRLTIVCYLFLFFHEKFEQSVVLPDAIRSE